MKFIRTLYHLIAHNHIGFALFVGILGLTGGLALLKQYTKTAWNFLLEGAHWRKMLLTGGSTITDYIASNALLLSVITIAGLMVLFLLFRYRQKHKATIQDFPLLLPFDSLNPYQSVARWIIEYGFLLWFPVNRTLETGEYNVHPLIDTYFDFENIPQVQYLIQQGILSRRRSASSLSDFRFEINQETYIKLTQIRASIVTRITEDDIKIISKRKRAPTSAKLIKKEIDALRGKPFHTLLDKYPNTNSSANGA